MSAATGPLLAQRPARNVWTLDSLFAAHAAPLITERLPAPRSASDEDLHAHRQDIEGALAAAFAPELSSGVACAVPATMMASHWHEALRAHQAQDADTAIAAYRGVLELQPDFARARYLLGLLLRDRGDQADAVAQLTLAVRAAPGFVDARAALANLTARGRPLRRGDRALPRRARRRAWRDRALACARSVRACPRPGQRGARRVRPCAFAAAGRCRDALQPRRRAAGRQETPRGAERLSARAGAGPGPDGRRIQRGCRPARAGTVGRRSRRVRVRHRTGSGARRRPQRAVRDAARKRADRRLAARVPALRGELSGCAAAGGAGARGLPVSGRLRRAGRLSRSPAPRRVQAIQRHRARRLPRNAVVPDSLFRRRRRPMCSSSTASTQRLRRESTARRSRWRLAAVPAGYASATCPATCAITSWAR